MSQLVPRGPASLDRLEDYDAANMYSDWSRDDKRMLVSLDGLLTGVQTPTTHTLTPATTLSAIIDMEQSDESYHNEAGFVPPVISAQHQASTYLNMVDTKSWQGGSATVTTMPPLPTLNSRPGITTTSSHTVNIPSGLPTSLPTAVVAPTPASATTPTRRNVGGRRPNKAKGISPEEEERRQVRRERNKAAAARCRKRRMDHTNALIKETEGLEHKKQGLQSEIQDLNEQLEELTYILEAHRATGTCRHTTGVTVPRPESPPDIKPVVVLPPEPLRIKQEAPPAPTSNFVFEQPPPAKRPMLAMTTAAPISVPPPAPVSAMAPLATPTTPVSITKPLRPTSLPVPPHIILKTNTTASEVAGIAISTPSTGIPFNFDSLMEGGTGLTPVSGPLVPSCSSQQRNHNSVDMASPDATIGNKLVSL